MVELDNPEMFRARDGSIWLPTICRADGGNLEECVRGFHPDDFEREFSSLIEDDGDTQLVLLGSRDCDACRRMEDAIGRILQRRGRDNINIQVVSERPWNGDKDEDE